MWKSRPGWIAFSLLFLTFGASSGFGRESASDAAHGLDLSAVGRGVAPGNDFFEYANGG